MKIYSIHAINFEAKKTSKNNKIKKQDKIRKHEQNKQKSIKDKFYSSINKYLNKEITKSQYFEIFENEVKDLKQCVITNSEKKYILDMITTMDLSQKLDKISDQYLKICMERLINNKK